VKELFAITHIHVHDGLGISIRELGALLPNHELPGQRSYGFFGQLPYGPPKRFRVREVELVAAGVLNGIPHRRDLDGPSLKTIYSEDDRPLEIRRLGDFHRA